jgi:hypothetical protein
LKNSFNFSNRFGIACGGMVGRNDQLGLCALQMGTPIRNDAIRAIWRVAPAAISNDRVVWDAWGNWELIHRLHESVVRFERIDAVRHAIKRPRCGVGDEKGLGRSINGRKQTGSPNEGGANAANPV